MSIAIELGHFGFENPLLQPQHPWFNTGVNNAFNAGFNSLPDKPLFEIEDARVVQRLVNNLMYLFSIEPGDHITFILGHGECSSNNAALQAWVLEELSDSVICQNDVLGELVSRLKDQLMMEVFS